MRWILFLLLLTAATIALAKRGRLWKGALIASSGNAVALTWLVYWSHQMGSKMFGNFFQMLVGTTASLVLGVTALVLALIPQRSNEVTAAPTHQASEAPS